MSVTLQSFFGDRRGEKGDAGPPGEKGERGEKGDSGRALPRPVRRAVVYLCLLAFVLSGANLFWSSHEAHVNQAANQAEQAAERRQGEHILNRVCGAFAELAANKPPPGNPRANPSRAYEQKNHTILGQMGTDLGCR